MKKEKNLVYRISLILTMAIAIWAVLFNENFIKVSNGLYQFLTKDFGWLYLIAMLVFVVFVIVLACSKYGKIKLGENDSKPEYKTTSWFAMLFGAGMGVGLVFWGIS
ncbi:MAG: BCCT family transporter, partial [Hungatella sp.]